MKKKANWRELDWRRPLFYCLLPVYIILVFVGFPPPFAPPPAAKPGQEQSMPEVNKSKKSRS
jgi:hypothetical protein